MGIVLLFYSIVLLLVIVAFGLWPLYFACRVLARHGRFSILSLLGLSTVVCVDLGFVRTLCEGVDLTRAGGMIYFGVLASLFSGTSLAIVGIFWTFGAELCELFGRENPARRKNRVEKIDFSIETIAPCVSGLWPGDALHEPIDAILVDDLDSIVPILPSDPPPPHAESFVDGR